MTRTLSALSTQDRSRYYPSLAITWGVFAVTCAAQAFAGVRHTLSDFALMLD